MTLALRPAFIDSVLLGSKLHDISQLETKVGEKINFQEINGIVAIPVPFEATVLSVQAIKIINKANNKRGVIIGTGDDKTKIVEHFGKEHKYPANHVCTAYLNMIARREGYEDRNTFFARFPDGYKGNVIHWSKFNYNLNLRIS